MEVKDIIEVKPIMKSPGTVESTFKPSSTNVKSFMVLKMKAKLDK